MAKDSSNRRKREEQLLSAADLPLATAIVLLDLAGCDTRTTLHEKGIIHGAIRSLYGASEEATIAIMQQAQNTIRSMRGSSFYAAALKDYLQSDAKEFLVKTMDDLIKTNGETTDLEIYLRNRFRDLIGLPLAA